MEHRIRSPSRTYSDMPETRRVDPPKKPKLPYSAVLVPKTAEKLEKPKPMFQIRKQEPFPQASNTPASQFRRAETIVQPVQATQTLAENAAATVGRNDNPRPGCSRESSGLRESSLKRVSSFNPFDMPRPGTSRDFLVTDIKTEGKKSVKFMDDEDIEVIVVEDSDSDSQSSSDSFSTRHFLKESRLPYNAAEDEEILKFVLSGNNIEKTSSILLWKELETRKENPKRTYQSLKNRFLRNIKPVLLTKYRKFLTPDLIKMLKRKFPDLRVVDTPPPTPPSPPSPPLAKKFPRARYPEKRVICVNPSMEGLPKSFYTDRHFGVINVTDRSEIKTIEPPVVPPPLVVTPPMVKPPNIMPPVVPSFTLSLNPRSEFRDGALRDNFLIQEPTPILPPPPPPRTTLETTQVNDLWADPSTSTSQIDRLVNIFARERLQNVPAQTFKYYETINGFSNRAAVNLKLILDRGGADSLPADLPVNVSVTVSVGKEEEAETGRKPRRLASGNKDNSQTKKEKIVKRKDSKKNSKPPPKRGYVLRIKDKYMNFYQKNNARIFPYQSLVDGLIDEIPPENDSRDTNCSTDDDSCYTQELKKISHDYKMEVKQTQCLIEDHSGENFSVNSAPTISPIQNPIVADKGSFMADLKTMLKDSSLSGHSLIRPCKI